MLTADGMQPFDEGGKSAAWYTAFYYLAERIRQVTDGALNHKSLYALVGLKERYVNHSNPMVRKRTAGTLSRTIHTKRYAQDMREAFSKDAQVFDHAAARICEVACEAQGVSRDELADWIVGVCWPDVRQGLVDEAGEWRSGLDLFRLDYEMSMLFEACWGDEGSGAGGAEALIAAILHVMAFGHLDVAKARALVDDLPRNAASPMARARAADEPEHACLVRFADQTRAVLTGFWVVSDDAPFEIGRYTDCEAIELSGDVSRRHCRIFREDGSWRLEDAGSRNGSTVRRDNARLQVGSGSATGGSLHLEFGDVIELPGGSTYLFSQIRGSGQVEFAKA